MKRFQFLYQCMCIVSLIMMSLVYGETSSSIKENHSWWTTIGGGYTQTEDPFGIAVAVSHSQRIGYHQFTARIIHYNEVKIFEGGSPYCYAYDIGVMYGPNLYKTLFKKEREGYSPRWWSTAVNLSAGIGVITGVTRGEYIDSDGIFASNYKEKPFSTIGCPMQLELRLIPTDHISISLNGSAQFNSVQSYYSAWIGFQYGLQRSKNDS